jgi:hypothetical protein
VEINLQDSFVRVSEEGVRWARSHTLRYIAGCYSSQSRIPSPGVLYGFTALIETQVEFKPHDEV